MATDLLATSSATGAVALETLDGAHVAVVNWRDLDHPLAGGAERYAWEMALALSAAGAQVDFVTARPRGQARREARDGVRIRRGGGVVGFYLYAVAYLLRHRSTLDAVIDPECGIPTFSPLFVRRTCAVVLVVHHVHQAQFAMYFPPALAALGRALEREVMPRVYRRRRTVAVSASTRSEMVEQLGWTGPVELLANGAAQPEEAGCAPDAKDPDQLVVLGRLVPHKRVDLVIRAAARVVADFPALRLAVCGRGPEEGPLKDLVDELGLAEHVEVMGYVSEETKARVLRRSILHVCASDVEGWGQVVIEAAAYGVPTIARDVPGLRDSIRQGETGWFAGDGPGDDEAIVAQLAATMRRLLGRLRDPDTQRRHHRLCRSWAAEFSWDRMRAQARELVADEIRACR